jgi:hypothetical protein
MTHMKFILFSLIFHTQLSPPMIMLNDKKYYSYTNHSFNELPLSAMCCPNLHNAKLKTFSCKIQENHDSRLNATNFYRIFPSLCNTFRVTFCVSILCRLVSRAQFTHTHYKIYQMCTTHIPNEITNCC